MFAVDSLLAETHSPAISAAEVDFHQSVVYAATLATCMFLAEIKKPPTMTCQNIETWVDWHSRAVALLVGNFTAWCNLLLTSSLRSYVAPRRQSFCASVFLSLRIAPFDTSSISNPSLVL